MPDFAGRLPGLARRRTMKQELIRALRLNIAAEREAIRFCAAHAEATEDELVVAESLCPGIGAPQAVCALEPGG